MSRAELADAVNAWLAEHSTRPGALTETYVAALEQGRVRWPGADYRAGFRAVLGADTDAELGFAPTNRPRVAAFPVHDVTAPSTATGKPGLIPEQMNGLPEVIAIRAMCGGFQAADRQVGGGVLYGTVARYLTTDVAPRLLDPTGLGGTALFSAACSVTEIAG
jgi:hypothetical protein